MRAGFIARLTFLPGGLLVWAAHFLFAYGLNGLACARGFDRAELFGFGLVPLILAVATLAALTAACIILVLALLGRGPGIAAETEGGVRDFWRFGTAIVAAFSIIAVIWTAIPALIIAPCA
jgi:hypothetical protein